MKLPWVSRDRLDAMQRLLDVAHAEARQERSIADVRYDALLEKYQALKMAGAVEVPKPLDLPRDAAGNVTINSLQPLYAPPADEMRELIDAQCGGNYRRRAMMLRQLAADRAAKVSDDDIRAAILNGVPSDGVPA